MYGYRKWGATVPVFVLALLGYKVAYADSLDFDKLTAALCRQLSHPQAPLIDSPECGGRQRLFGGSLAISYKGKIIYEVATGAADVEGTQKVDRSSLFRVASLHKPITAIGVMRLVQDGELSLKDRVFGNADQHGVDGIIDDKAITRHIRRDSKVLEITVDHLLRHTSGWPKESGYAPFALRKSSEGDRPSSIAAQFGDHRHPDLETLIKYMASLEPAEEPGKVYQYNNMNYMVLNKVIEVASGLPYEEYFRRNIFAPLGNKQIKPAKTFRADKYLNEVEYIWPSLTEPSNQHEQYCTGEKVPSQYGLFRLEGTWVATPRGLISLFDAIDKGVSTPKVLDDATIDKMFDAERISGTNVARGWANVASENANAGDWSFTGGTAGTAARFVKSHDGFKIAYLRNASANVLERKAYEKNKDKPAVEEAFKEQWSPRWLTAIALQEARNQDRSALETAKAIASAPASDEWKEASLSAADLRAGCRVEEKTCDAPECFEWPSSQPYQWPSVFTPFKMDPML